MQTERPRVFTEILYHEAAQEYLRSLPLEHFMEATPQAHQREITLASLALVHARRPEVQYFNELLVQYSVEGRKKPRQVVPDNMVVMHPEPIRAEGSFDVPLQPARPFWMLEYVSRSNKRKDYDDNMDRYERELAVPYYLLFQPDLQELTLYRHNGRRYDSVKPNESGRSAIQESELEVALLDSWVRYWFRGELLLLPAELLRQVDDFRRRAHEEKHRADEEKHRADEEKRRADSAEQRAEAAERELARLRALLDKQS